MSIQIAIILSIVLMGTVGIITYYVGNKTSEKLIKYAPAIASAFGLLFFYVKMNFITYNTHAFEGIYDMIAIILLAIICGASLIGAIIIEVRNSGKSNLQN